MITAVVVYHSCAYNLYNVNLILCKEMTVLKPYDKIFYCAIQGVLKNTYRVYKIENT